jgi:hypothetical protein
VVLSTTRRALTHRNRCRRIGRTTAGAWPQPAEGVRAAGQVQGAQSDAPSPRSRDVEKALRFYVDRLGFKHSFGKASNSCVGGAPRWRGAASLVGARGGLQIRQGGADRRGVVATPCSLVVRVERLSRTARIVELAGKELGAGLNVVWGKRASGACARCVGWQVGPQGTVRAFLFGHKVPARAEWLDTFPATHISGSPAF